MPFKKNLSSFFLPFLFFLCYSLASFSTYLASATTIAMVAPSYGASQNEIARIKYFLEKAHFNVQFNPNSIAHHPTSLGYAAPHSVRLQTVKEAFNSDEVDIIWAMRGGYGAFELLEDLKKMPPPKKKKLLIGFSDTTHLHLFVEKYWGWDSLHGPCLKFNQEINPSTNGKTSLFEIIKFLQNPKTSYQLTPFNSAATHQSHPINAPIIGGNLSVLTANLGHFNQPHFKNKLILLEETAESPQKIMRMLTQLKFAGAFNECAGIILGDFIKTSPQTNKLLKRFFAEINKPCFKSNLFGHGAINKPLPLGKNLTLYPGGELKIPSTL